MDKITVIINGMPDGTFNGALTKVADPVMEKILGAKISPPENGIIEIHEDDILEAGPAMIERFITVMTFITSMHIRNEIKKHDKEKKANS